MYCKSLKRKGIELQSSEAIYGTHTTKLETVGVGVVLHHHREFGRLQKAISLLHGNYTLPEAPAPV